MNEDMRVPQPRLGRGGMIALITMCNAIAPLSTDMYMPALPDMASYFHTTDAVMNMTLVGFFLFFAIGMLVFGCLLFLFGHRMPALFALCFAPIMITSSVSRPFATAILLNLQSSDTGSASSLSNFAFTLSGTVGMLLITSLWSDYILGICILAVSAALVGGALCLRLRAKAGPSALSVFRGE